MKFFALASLALLPAMQAVAQSSWDIIAYSTDDCSDGTKYATVVGTGDPGCVTWSGASWWMNSYGGCELIVYSDGACQDYMIGFAAADATDVCYDNSIDSYIGPYGSFSFSC